MSLEERISPEEARERREALRAATETAPEQLKAELVRKHAGYLHKALETSGLTLKQLEEKPELVDILAEQAGFRERGLSRDDARKALNFLLEQAKEGRAGKLEEMFGGEETEEEDSSDAGDIQKAA
ncbi:hypothetical protein L0Y40_00685 [Candidatus Wolfebacteria bacterium]|nr:hypothetical protein [Candidatus Wolfebacteria bacterium]